MPLRAFSPSVPMASVWTPVRAGAVAASPKVVSSTPVVVTRATTRSASTRPAPIALRAAKMRTRSCLSAAIPQGASRTEELPTRAPVPRSTRATPAVP